MIRNSNKLDGCVDEILDLAKDLEQKYGIITITSGLRDWPKGSQHTFGKAMDVIVQDVHPIKVAAYVLETHPEVTGFGLDVYQGYCHFDTGHKERTFWVYGTNGEVA